MSRSQESEVLLWESVLNRWRARAERLRAAARIASTIRDARALKQQASEIDAAMESHPAWTLDAGPTGRRRVGVLGSAPMPPSEHATTLLELLQRRGIGVARVRELLATTKPGDPLLDIATARFGTGLAEVAEAERRTRDLVHRCEDLGIAIIGIGEPGYPKLLAKIRDAPPVLFVRGELALEERPGVAVVGTRKASGAGLRIARTIASFLARRQYTVVSGLALGIDAAGHEGSLEGRGPTVAVLAHGLDIVTPAAHRDLAARILAEGGALVSEHPPGVPPHRAEFVRRNRIQSGMSIASIVVESDVEGGSMHQARFTSNQGRKLLTVLAATDESRDDLNESGARKLIADLHATAIRSTRDVGRELAALTDRAGSDDSGVRQRDLEW